MDELSKLAIKYGTDKWGKHHYTPVYYDLFKDKRNEVKKVLEIGPAEGAGMFMFRDFFPNATIYGLEIDEERVKKLEGLDRIVVLPGNQFDLLDLESSLSFFSDEGDLDLVIDDGSHKLEHQVFTCLTLMPMLSDKTIYIIEDVADTSIIKYLTPYNAKLINVGKRYDDNLIICQK